MSKCYVVFTTLHMIDPEASRAGLNRQEWVLAHSGEWGDAPETVRRIAEERIRFFTLGYPYLCIDMVKNMKVMTKSLACQSTPFRSYRTRVLDRAWVLRCAEQSKSQMVEP